MFVLYATQNYKNGTDEDLDRREFQTVDEVAECIAAMLRSRNEGEHETSSFVFSVTV